MNEQNITLDPQAAIDVVRILGRAQSVTFQVRSACFRSKTELERFHARLSNFAHIEAVTVAFPQRRSLLRFYRFKIKTWGTKRERRRRAR